MNANRPSDELVQAWCAPNAEDEHYAAFMLAREVAASRRAVKALRELHYVQDAPWLKPWCPRCGEDWPCQIAAILDKEGL